MLLEVIAQTSCELLGWSQSPAAPPYQAVDTHCHLGFYSDARAMAVLGKRKNIGFFSGTVTPQEYREVVGLLGQEDNVCVGLGFHPWWVQGEKEDATSANQRALAANQYALAQTQRPPTENLHAAAADQKSLRVAAADHQAASDHQAAMTNQSALALFEESAAHTRFISEVGLDFSAHHKHTQDEQLRVFVRILQICATGEKVISLHSVKAADKVLDLLERYKTLRRNAVIFHWFSGTSNELHRAVGAGCYFSLGERFLATKRAKEYLKVIPRDRLLLETDYPPKPGEEPSEGLFDSLNRAALSLLSYYDC